MPEGTDAGRRTVVSLPDGAQLTYREVGHGPAVVFVHGVLANGDLWRDVVPAVAQQGYRCLAVDLPLGGHRTPMPAGSDLSPPGVARLVGQFLVELDLDDVTLVGNDTGGAIVQLVMANKPPRVGRVVLTSSDALERFFPPLFAFLHWLGYVPGGAWLIAQTLRWRWLRRLPLAFGWVTERGLPDDLAESFLGPSRTDPGVRRDLAAFLRGVHRRHTLAAAQRLGDFDRPVLLAWSREDRLFPMELAHRLAELLPDARVAPIDDAYTFSPIDRPDVVATRIIDFLRGAA